MPEWKPQVVEAFQTLNLDIDVATLEEAAKAYKIQAIRTHPDKNLDDPAATMRFQTLGAAWTTCQRHFEDPESSYVTSAPYDEEVDLDDLGFFMFMFEEAINERYFSSRKYRRSRGQGPRVVLTPFGSFGVFPSESSYTSSPSYHSGPSSYSGGGYSGGGYSRSRQLKADDYNERDQARDKAGYEKRLREFEKQIEREEEELRRQAKEKSKDEEKRAAAYQQAFHAARAGKAGLVLSLVQEYDLDVNFKIPKVTSKNKPPPFQTLLHAACRVCDEGLIIFLLDRGAIPDALNDAKMTPFHVAISCGNVAVVKFFLLRRVHGKQTPGCHPSKTAPSGLTPLQIAIASGNAEMVAIMTQQATVHDVERCWLQPDAAPLRSILLEKKGFVDPETKELRRQEEERKVAEERAREEQRVADEKERLAEKARLKDERQRRAAEQKAREEEKKREEAVLARQKQEAEERKAELERMAAEARRREEQEAAESRRRAEREAAEAEARRSAELGAAEARRKAEAAARRKAQQEAEAQRKADAERERRRVEQEAAETRRRAEEAEAERLTEARLRAEAEARKLAEEQERARRQEEENIRLQQVAAQEAERQRRAALEQQRVEKKRAETLRRLQAQAEEHRRLAEARAPVEPKPAAPQRPSKLETHNMAPQSTKPLTEVESFPKSCRTEISASSVPWS
ncbi:hypothetical protein C8R45DRAFT_64811 [Mycena sanguinolenta]|nr:hypothetical protein C8R45DRAFT_64811 [Mycena sanguinolenta]